MPPPCQNVPLTFCGRDFNPFYFPPSTLPIFALPVELLVVNVVINFSLFQLLDYELCNFMLPFSSVVYCQYILGATYEGRVLHLIAIRLYCLFISCTCTYFLYFMS